MAQIITFNGSSYTIPDVGETDWGQNVTDYLVAIPNGALQPTGGLFSLSAEVDFGANFGLMSIYYKSRSANIADAGIVRLARTDLVSWRNQANSANLDLAVNTSDQLMWNGVVIESDTLASSQMFVGDAGNSSTARAMSGAWTVDNLGVTAISPDYIINSMVNSAAGILYSKLEVITANRMLVSSAGGLLIVSNWGYTFTGDHLQSAAEGGLHLVDSGGTNFAGLQAPTTISVSYTAKLPTAQGAAGETFINDGAGNLTWGSVAGSGTVNSGTAGFFAYYAGTGTAVSDQTLFQLTLGRNLTQSTTAIGLTVNHILENLDTTDTGSASRYIVRTNAAGSGDPYLNWEVFGVTNWAMGIDNSDGDSLVITQDATLGGVNNRMRFTTAGLVEFTVADVQVNSIGAARVGIVNGGAGTGDAYLNFNIASTANWTIGIDDDDADSFVLTEAAILGGVNNRLRIPTGGQIQVSDGLVGSPTYSYISSPTTGMWLSGTNQVSISTNGVQRWSFDADGDFTSKNSGIIRNADGTVSFPAYGWELEVNSGFYRSGTFVTSLALNGAQFYKFEAGGQTIYGDSAAMSMERQTNSRKARFQVINTSGGMRIHAGPNGAPEATVVAFQFETDVPTGNTPNTTVLAGGQWQYLAGTVAAPVLSFRSDTDTGVRNNASNSYMIVTGGADRWNIDAVGSLTSNNNSIIRNGGGSAASPSFSHVGDPDTGGYSSGTNQWGIAANGVPSCLFDADTTATQTRLIVINSADGLAKRVSWGATGSGGTGFKVLRIPN